MKIKEEDAFIEYEGTLKKIRLIHEIEVKSKLGLFEKMFMFMTIVIGPFFVARFIYTLLH